MEGDDGAIPHVFLYFSQYLPSVEALAIVAGHEVPHHDGISVLQHHVLSPTHPSVRRTEKIALDESIRLVGIFQIALSV